MQLVDTLPLADGANVGVTSSTIYPTWSSNTIPSPTAVPESEELVTYTSASPVADGSRSAVSTSTISTTVSIRNLRNETPSYTVSRVSYSVNVLVLYFFFLAFSTVITAQTGSFVPGHFSKS